MIDILTRAKALLATAQALHKAAGESEISPGIVPELVVEIEQMRQDNAQLQFALEQSEIAYAKLARHHNEQCACGQLY